MEHLLPAFNSPSALYGLLGPGEAVLRGHIDRMLSKAKNCASENNRGYEMISYFFLLLEATIKPNCVLHSGAKYVGLLFRKFFPTEIQMSSARSGQRGSKHGKNMGKIDRKPETQFFVPLK